MHRIFKKEQILTIPNLLSLVRLMLIPVIVWLYCKAEEYSLAVFVVMLSGLTDLLDGFIARKYNMISDFGKILDPIADKLTQAAMIFCLATRYKRMWYLVGIFAVKEAVMGFFGWLTLKRTDIVSGAKWHGKVNTMLLYAVMALLIMMPNLGAGWVSGLITLCEVSMVLSLTLYSVSYVRLLKGNRK